jgi:hypothetical protein
MAKQKKKAGRPSGYTNELAEQICDQIALGFSLNRICRAEVMPHIRTVHRWLDAKPDFATKYARARELMADHYFDEMQDIADAATAETANVAKLRLDTMRWRISKLLPKKYGDKVETAHTGAVEVRHLQVNVMPAMLPVMPPRNGNGQ